MPCSQPGPAAQVYVPPYQEAPPAPGAPTVGTPQVVSSTTAYVSVSWNTVSGATYYKVFVNGQEVTQTQSTSVTLTLTPGQTYQIAIAACN